MARKTQQMISMANRGENETTHQTGLEFQRIASRPQFPSRVSISSL